MSDIAEKWANTPDPPRPKKQQTALDELLAAKWERFGAHDKRVKAWYREMRAARDAYRTGISRPEIARALDRELQTVHNWVNPVEEPTWSNRYGDPSDEQLRQAGIDV